MSPVGTFVHSATRLRYLSVLALTLVALSLPACQRHRAGSQLPLGQPFAGSVPGVTIEWLIDDGGRLDWSHRLNLVAFDRKGQDGNYDVWTMRPDARGQVCLTCETPGLPSRHVGQPAWHPSGNWLAVQAEKPVHAGGSLRARPGIGGANDIWIIPADGGSAFRITDVPEDQAVLHPKFSHSGDRLMWAERLVAPPGDQRVGGEWIVRLANFTVVDGEPRVSELRTLDLGLRSFVETHAFSPDDSRILISANLKTGQPAYSMDIHEVDLTTLNTVNLTDSDDWDEHAHWSPAGDRIVWMSSRGSGTNPAELRDMTTDLWIMNRDGSVPRRLTRFSDPDAPEHAGSVVVVGDPAWSPDGRRVLARLIVDRGAAQLLGLRREVEPIVMINLPQ